MQIHRAGNGISWSIERELRLVQLVSSGAPIHHITREFKLSRLTVIRKIKQLRRKIAAIKSEITNRQSHAKKKPHQDLPVFLETMPTAIAYTNVTPSKQCVFPSHPGHFCGAVRESLEMPYCEYHNGIAYTRKRGQNHEKHTV